jgi:hypothetical protein
VKVLLVPWSDSWNVILRIYSQTPTHVDDYEAEVSTKNGQKIIVGLLQKEACNVRPTFKDSFRRVVFEADVPDVVAGRLLKALKALGRFRRSGQIPESLAEKPSLEELEKFLRDAGAPEHSPPEEVANMERICRRLWDEQRPARVDGGYLVLAPGYNLYFVSDDGNLFEVRLPRRMLFEAAIYSLCAGRLKLNIKRKEGIPASVLSQIARILKEEAPHLLPVILP